MKLKINEISNKEFSFTWNDPMHTTLINIRLPDLSDAEYSLWGDWGHMYTFELRPTSPISIKYGKDIRKLECKKLLIESPMNGVERSQNPFYIKFTDTIKGLVFKVYIDQNYEYSRAEIIRDTDKVLCYATQEDHASLQAI